MNGWNIYNTRMTIEYLKLHWIIDPEDKLMWDAQGKGGLIGVAKTDNTELSFGCPAGPNYQWCMNICWTTDICTII